MKTKTQFTNRILSLVLSIMMVVSMLPMNIMTARAADGDAVAKVGDSEYTDFATAVANWTDGTTLTLLADVTGLTECIKTYAKGLILDLNGHKIECSDTLCTIWIDGDSGSELTIRDGKGDGYIQGRVYAVTGGSKLRLESGTVETVTANGDFIMTGGQIICEDSRGLLVNAEVDVVISGGEIYGSNYGVWTTSGNVIISGDTKITGAEQYAIMSFSSKVVISGTPTISGGAGEFWLMEEITLNTQPADGETWRVEIDTEENTDGLFAVPGEGVTLDASKFASTMDGYDVKQNAKGELLLCNHQTAYAAVSNEDGSTHKMLCCCRETTVEASVACSGFGATCQTKAVCAACGQSYGETIPDAHTFNDDGKCVCGAERDAATTVDLSSLTATYVISDSGEYIFTGTGSYGIKVEIGYPKIVLNNVNISLTDGDYYDNDPINGIHIACGTTEILVMGENSITAEVGAGIFVAEGGTVKITGSSREDILIATGAGGCSGIGGYVCYTNGSVNCGNIEISNVTVKASGSNSSMGDRTPAIGGAGNGNCGYITIDNADVYAEGFINPHSFEGSSAIGTGVGWRNREGSTIGEISIINDSKVYVIRGNYCDYIGCSGSESDPAEGVVDATAKSSTIYCYDKTYTTKPIQTLKYGALGGLLKEDGTCEGVHTGIICDNCGYCSCTHEGGKLTYALTEDGAKHTATYDCCGMKVTEDHTLTHTANGNVITAICSENCGYAGKATISATGKTYDGTAVEVIVSKTGSLENTVIPVTLTKNGEAFTGEPVNAGTYTASVTLDDKTVSVNFTIAKAAAGITLAPTPNTLTYTSEALNLITAGEANGGTMVYSLTENGEYTTTIPRGTNAGDYTVWYYVQGDANHNDSAKDSVSVTIEKATVTVTADPKTKAYGNADPKLTYTVNGLFGEDKLIGALSRTEGENAGKYAITQGTLAASDNYTISFTGAELTIIDVTAPTGEILIKNNGWKQFWNWISFSLFCKDNVDVTVTADGTGSGVTKVEYLLSDTALEEINIPVDGWTTLNADNGKYSFSIKPQNKVAVYVRITDEGDNVTVINSDGIVVYEDSKAVDTEVTYTYKENSNKDIAVEFNGNAVKSIVCGEKVLTANSDYTVDYESGKIVLMASYLDTLNAGDYTFTVSYDPMGVENSGVTDLTTTFIVKVEPTSIAGATVTVNGTFTYDGNAKTPDPVVVQNGETLVKDRDYTVSCAENVNAGTATVTVIGKGNYSGTKTATFSIAPMELDETNTVVTLDQNTFVYDGTEHKPAVTVTFNGATLTEGVDYRVFYSQPMRIVNGKVDKWFSDHTTSVECVNVDGDYYAVVVGLGNFRTKDAFTLYANFVIEKAIVTEPTIASKPYNGSAQMADISDTDLYTVEKNNGGTVKGSYDAVLKLKDSANYKWSTTDNAEVTLQFVISAAQNTWDTNPSISGWTYGEAAKTPVGTAKYGAVKVVYTGKANDGTDYNSEIAPTKAGNYTATFTVTGTEDYSGLSEQVNFTIAKKAVTVTANDASKTYGDAVPTYTVKYEGFKNGDDKDDLSGTLEFDCGYAQFSDKGEYTIKASGYTSGNYTISYVDGKLTVNAKPITVTIQNAASVYGENLAELKATDNGIVNGDANVYSIATTAKSTSNVGKYTITGTALDDNYDVTFVNGEYEIIKREITITVDAKNTVVNTTLPTYTYKAEGLVGVDTLVTEPTLTCNANIALIGEYDITATGADAGGNYSIKYVPDKLTVLTDNAVDAAAGYTEELKDYDPKAVTSEDKAELDEMLSEINTILADETTTDNGKKALEEVKEQVEKLIKEITDAAEATDTENTEKVENVTPENVTPENKTDLEGAKTDLEKALEDNGGNYTEDEKQAIEDEIKRIDDALEVIGNVEAVEKVISKLPAVDTVKPDDEEAIKAITDAQTAYNALSDYEKSLVDEATKANLDKLAAALVAYDIVEGDGSSWTEDSDHSITFVVNGLFGKFVGIKIDGKDVDKANYEAKAGSTIITLKASYLDTLAVGEHTITVVYTDGSTDGAFNVHAKANSPATGDNSHMFLWIALLFISGGAVITLTVVDRKKRVATKR